MTTDGRMNNADQDLTDQVINLYKRGYKLTGWAVSCGIAAVAMAATGGVWAWRAHVALPAQQLKELDIPYSVMARISDYVAPVAGSSSGGIGGGVGLPFESVTDHLTSLITVFNGPVMFTVGLLGLVVSGAAIVLGRDSLGGGLSSLARLGVGFGMIVVASNTLSTITGAGDSDERPAQSDRAAFMAAVDANKWAVVERDLPLGNALDTDYVRAQVELMKQSQNPQTDLFKRVSSGLEGKPGFTPNEQVAYLIDEAAFSQAKTEIARSYLDESKARYESRKAWSTASFNLAGVLALLSFGLGWVARTMLKRVYRIDAELALDLDRNRKKAQTAAK